MSSTAPQPIPTAPAGREPISRGAPPGGPPEGPPFQSALETESARTAIAEGQQQSRSHNRGRDTKELATGTATGPTTASAVTLPAGTDVIPNSDAPPAPGGSSPPSADGTPTPGTPTAPGGSSPAGADGTPTPGTPTAPGNSAPAGADGTPTPGTPPTPGGSPSASAVDALTATAPDGAPHSSHPNHTDAALASPRDSTPAEGILAIRGNDAPPAGPGTQAHSAPPTPPSGQLPVAHASSAPATHTGPGTGTGDLAKTTLNSPTPSTGANAGGQGSGLPENTASPLLSAALEGDPAAPPGEPGSAAYGVGLQEAIESLHGTIQLTARQGLSQARISLHPEELGEIRINLTQTAQGLLARVSAESPAAAQALAAARAQLRQSLSSLGINLARLDIGHHDPSTQSGGSDHSSEHHNGATHGEGSSASRPGRPAAGADPTDPAIDPLPGATPAPSTTAGSHGTLIDVLA